LKIDIKTNYNMILFFSAFVTWMVKFQPFI